ncbi:MAG: MFS transporter [Legionellaceae bacterium]|nr:MFS transporter [Legionellaceae bacterium]
MSDSLTINRTRLHASSNYLPWLICLSAGFFFFYEFFQLNVFDVINQPLRHDFDIDAAQLSWMSSTFIWANVLFLLPAGFILDRFSVRRVILIALFICLIGTFGFGLSSSFALAAFFHSLTGVGNAFCFLSCVVLVSRWFPPRRQASVIGCIVTMAFLGGMAAHTPLAYLNTHYGWRHAVFLDGMLGAFIWIWIAIIVQDKTQDRMTQKQTTTWWPKFKQSLLNRQNWLAGTYTACLNLPIMVLCALWGGSYLREVHQLNSIAASNIISLIFIGSIVGCPFVGWLSDAHGKRKPLMIIGAIATFLTVLPLFMGIPLSETTLSILFVSLGLFTSTQVIGYPFIAESNPLGNTGTATGVASMIVMGGGGIAQVLFGMLMQQHAGQTILHYTVTDFQYAMWMFPIAAVIAFIMSFCMRETHGIQH